MSKLIKILDATRDRFKTTNDLALKNRELIEESIAQQQLLKAIEGPFFFPQTTFSMSNCMLLHVLNDIIINNRKQVIEFGAGYSTLVLSKLIQQGTIDCTLTTIESDLEWLNQMHKMIHQNQTNSNVHLIHSQLVPQEYKLEIAHDWYDSNWLNDTKTNEFDLVMIDGPKAGVDELMTSRYPAIPFLLTNQKINLKHCSIYLDDAKRKGEQAILKSWKTDYALVFKQKNKYAYYNPLKMNVHPF